MLMKSSYAKSVSHIGYWIGDSLGDLLPGIDEGQHADTINEYFATLENVLIQGKIDDVITGVSWKRVTNKVIYSEKAKFFPPPKIERDLGKSLKRVWGFLRPTIVTSTAHDICYLLVHNKLPVRERIFRIGMVNDPYCPTCPGAQICDVEHFFCYCERLSTVWVWMKAQILELTQQSDLDSNIITFAIPKCQYENEVAWLLSSYVEKVWNDLHVKGLYRLKAQEFFGYLKFKYRADQLGARMKLSSIAALN